MIIIVTVVSIMSGQVLNCNVRIINDIIRQKNGFPLSAGNVKSYSAVSIIVLYGNISRSNKYKIGGWNTTRVRPKQYQRVYE